MMKSMIVTDYKGIIATCFAQDHDLISTWHLNSGESLDNCVNQTYYDMLKVKVEFNVIHDGSDLVGYFVKEMCQGAEFLSGFFVMPKYRKKETIGEFWAMIKSEFNTPFFCGLYKKNKPAIEFIKRNGGEIAASVDDQAEPGLIFRMEQ